MNWRQALVYFFREASVNLVRSWKISVLAISTIGVSLFIGGCFLVVVGNLSQMVESWRDEAKVVVYLVDETAPESAGELHELLATPAWVTGVEAVSAEEARERFVASFPSISELVHGWGYEPLPASIEVSFDPLRVEAAAFDAWLAEIRSQPAVGMIDDDRDWVRQLEAVLRVVAAAGLTLGTVLVVAAIVTIASVIRLTAYLYRDEIAVMRLVGATELFIRGPFYVEGLLQGLTGGLLALIGLFFSWQLVAASEGVFVGVLTATFLSVPQQALLVAVGALAGLAGAVASLRREAS